ncbi:hypothetical protein DMP23_04345 [Amycolatopsis sp. A1MSW2902]
MKGSLRELDSLKEPFTDLEQPRFRRLASWHAVRGTLTAADSRRVPLTTPPRSPHTHRRRMRPNAALGASDAPNAAFGAWDAPNATLGIFHPGLCCSWRVDGVW